MGNSKKIDEEFDDSNNEQGNLFNYLSYLLIFIIISFLSLFFISKYIGEVSNFSVLKGISLHSILGILFLLVFYYLFDGLRLYYVLKVLNTDIDLKHMVKLVFINIFISNITPFASGGGFFQIYFLNKKGISLGNATAATTIRTVLATLFFFIVTPIILIKEERFVNVFPQRTVLFYISLFSILYLIFFYIVIFKNRTLKKIIYSFLNFLESKDWISRKKFRRLITDLFEEIDIFAESLASFFSGDLRYILSSIVFTLLFLFSEFSFSVFLIRGLGYDVPIILIIYMQIVVVFFMYFAPTPGATGVAEGSYSLIFSKFVENGHIVPIIFAWRFFTKYIGIFIGMIFFSTGFIRRRSKG